MEVPWRLAIRDRSRTRGFTDIKKQASKHLIAGVSQNIVKTETGVRAEKA